MKTVCFFGIYKPSYNRNRVLMGGFRENGWRVLECRVDPRRMGKLRKYFVLVKARRALRNEPIDLVIVAFPGHTVVWLARLLFGNRIVFDLFLSLHDSNVADRRVHSPRSPAALLDWFWDWSAPRLSRATLLETEAMIQYFMHISHLPRERFIRVFVGSDLTPAPARAVDPNLVHFHGTYIPLHGIETILEAAKLLADTPVHFRLVGRGQEYEKMRAYATKLALTNVEFDESILGDALPEALAGAAVCLGIFGKTEKASRVIPNKVYECLAIGKAIITADTPAIHELEVFGEPLPMILVPPGDSAALAEAIRRLMHDNGERERLARAARRFFEAYLTPVGLVGDLIARIPPEVL